MDSAIVSLLTAYRKAKIRVFITRTFGARPPRNKAFRAMFNPLFPAGHGGWRSCASSSYNRRTRALRSKPIRGHADYTCMEIYPWRCWPGGVLRGVFGFSAFVNVVKIDPSLDVVASTKTIALFFTLQFFAGCVSPSMFFDKRIPSQDLIFGRLLAPFKTPVEQFFVRSAFESSLCQLIEIDFPKAAETRIEATRIGKTKIVPIWQKSLRIQPDLVEQAREKTIPSVLM